MVFRGCATAIGASFGGDVVVEIVVAVTGAVLSPPVAGWFAVAASPDGVWTDGVAAAGGAVMGTELSGIDEPSAAPVVGWVGPCGEVVVAPNSCSLGSGAPDSGRSLEDMVVRPRWQVAIDGDPLGKRTLSTGVEGMRIRLLGRR